MTKFYNFLLLLLIAMLPYSANAQWKIGVTGGATLNHYTVDKQYMEDWQCSNLWGGTAGITAQYDFLSIKKWELGVRADLNWTQKNHKEFRTDLVFIPIHFNNHYFNNYIQLPLMVSVGYGGKLKVFANAGFYSGYWISGYNIHSNTYSVLTTFSTSKGVSTNSLELSYNFNNKRDRRFDIGFVGGVGIEWQFSKRWGAEIEARYYRSSNTRKDYMIIKSPHYNDTFVFQAGMLYYL